MGHVEPINTSVSPSQSHAGIGLLGVGIIPLPPSKKHRSGNFGLAGSQPANQPGFSCDTFDPVFITVKTPSRLGTHTLFLFLHRNAHSESFMPLRPRGYLLRNAKIMGLLSRFVASLKKQHSCSYFWKLAVVLQDWDNFCFPYKVYYFMHIWWLSKYKRATLKSSRFNAYLYFLEVDNTRESL